MLKAEPTPKPAKGPIWLSTLNSLAGQLFIESLKYRAPARIVHLLRTQEVCIPAVQGRRPTYADIFEALYIKDEIQVSINVNQLTQDKPGKRMVSVLIEGKVRGKRFFIYSGFRQVHFRAGQHIRGIISTSLDIYATKRKKAIGVNP